MLEKDEKQIEQEKMENQIYGKRNDPESNKNGKKIKVDL